MSRPPEPLAQLRALDPHADAGHALRVARLALRIASVFDEDLPRERLYRAACLHDLGKRDLHHLDGLPRALSCTERRCIEGHAPFGADLLATLPDMPAELIACVRHHHERDDGRGYPDELQGDAIPLGARIIAIADSYDALATDRPYRARWRAEDARAYIRQHAGTRFDPHLVLAFDLLDV